MSSTTNMIVNAQSDGLTSSVTNSDEEWPPQSDAAFNATPTKRTTIQKSFVQNDIALQRSSSMALERATALGRVLSNRTSQKLHLPEHVNSIVPEENRDAPSSLLDNGRGCSLKKSLSERSTKSVLSLHATGTYPFGTLHVHSPSPIRSCNSKTHEFLTHGDIIVTRGIEPGVLVGCDTERFTIRDGQSFEGLKNVPMGVHLIWSSADSSSLRQGFWIISSKRAQSEFGEVMVKRWDKNSKVLDKEVSAAEIMIQQRSVPEFIQDLVAYHEICQQTRTRHLDKRPNIWVELTSCIRGSRLTKITGSGWNEWIVSSTQDRKPLAHDGLREHSMSYAKNEVLSFTLSPDYKSHFRSVGREQTNPLTDTSGLIQTITRTNCDDNDPDEIIGELQFCYLTGTLLKNQACVEHWTYVVQVVFQAFLMVVDEPIFFTKFIKAVHSQLIFDERGVGESIFDHIVSFKIDLKNILTVFKSRLIEMLVELGSDLTDDQNNVGKAFEDLESWLCGWNWDLRGNTGIGPKESESHIS